MFIEGETAKGKDELKRPCQKVQLRKKRRRKRHSSPQPVQTVIGKEELEDMIGIFRSRYSPERKG